MGHPVPIGKLFLARIEQRHDIVVGQQNAVHRVDGRHLLVAILGRGDHVDELIDSRIGNPRVILRAGRIGGFGAPIAALLVAGVHGLAPDIPDHVIVETADAVDILRRVDRAKRRRDPDLGEAVDERLYGAHQRRAAQKNFEAEGLAGLRIDHLVALELIARGLEQCDGLLQIVTHLLRIAVDRIGVGRGEHVSRNLVLQAVQDFQFLTLRQAGGRQFRSPEETVHALQPAIGEVLVHVLKVEGIVQRTAHAGVLEQVTAHVGHQRLHDACGTEAVRQGLADDAPVLHRLEIIAGGPAAGALFLVEIDISRLEGLELCFRIVEVNVGHDAEIVGADIGRQVRTPIVLAQLVADRRARLHGGDLIGTGPHRQFQRALGNVALIAVRILALPPVLRKNGKLADDFRKLAIALLVEGESHFPLAGLLCGFDMAIIIGEAHAIGLGAVEAEDDVVRRDRLAIGPLCFRP